MAYTRTTWVDGTTPVDASRLNNIEGGILNLEAAGSGNPFTAMPYVGAAPIVESSTGYVKYADGTMICWGSTASDTTANAAGNVFYSGALAIGFPVAFHAAPLVVASVAISTGIAFGTRVSSVTVSGASGLVIGSASTDVGIINWIAIGRWKA